ncbi:general transcriptional corepressor trfA [Hydra vulgaris]|uniref:general transcriptional corepressor trfA n=1 Tax=Hydra vulgaris TaxID=6087 RepID=UPI0032EA7F25
MLCNNNIMFCNTCNQTRDGKFCSECGSKLNEVKTILPNNPATQHSEQKENHSIENQFNENKDGVSHSNVTGSKAVENEDLFCITHPKTYNYEGIKTVEAIPVSLLEESSYNKIDSKSNENSEKTEDLAENKTHERSNHLVSNPSENKSVYSPAESIGNNNDGKEKLNNLINNTKEKDMAQAEIKPYERSNNFESNPLENMGVFSSAKNVGNKSDDEEKLNNLSNSAKVEDVDLPENKPHEKNNRLESSPLEKSVGNKVDDEEKLNLSNSTKVEDVDLPENKPHKNNNRLESSPLEKSVGNEADDEEKLNNISNSTKVEDVDLPENKSHEKNNSFEPSLLEKSVGNKADVKEKINNLSNSTKVEDVDLPENKPHEKNNRLESSPLEKSVGNEADDEGKLNNLSNSTKVGDMDLPEKSLMKKIAILNQIH